MAEIAIKLTGKDDLTKTIKSCTKEIKSMNDAVDNIDAAELRKMDKQFQSTINSSKSVGRQLSEIKKQINEMNYKKLDGTPTYNKMVAKAKELQAAIDKTKQSLADAKKETSSFKDALNGINIKGINLGSIATKGVGYAAVAAGVAAAAKGIGDYVVKTNESIRTTQTLTGLTSELANEFNAYASALSSHFDGDMTEIVRTANALMKTYGVTTQEAMELVEDGFIDGANAAGDMLDNIREYATQAKSAGITAKEFINILSQGQNLGIFSDKAIDTIKEGNLRIREMTTATHSAFQTLGLDADDLKSKIEKGAMSTWDVMKMVSKKLDELGDQAPGVGQAIADIFGGPGEDAGYQYIAMLHKMQTQIGAVDGQHQAMNDTLKKQIEAERKLTAATQNFAKVCQPIITGLTALWTDFLNTVSKVLAFVMGASSEPLKKSGKNSNRKVKTGTLLDTNSEEYKNAGKGWQTVREVNDPNIGKKRKAIYSSDGNYYKYVDESYDNKWRYSTQGAAAHNAMVKTLPKIDTPKVNIPTTNIDTPKVNIPKTHISSNKTNKKQSVPIEFTPTFQKTPIVDDGKDLGDTLTKTVNDALNGGGFDFSRITGETESEWDKLVQDIKEKPLEPEIKMPENFGDNLDITNAASIMAFLDAFTETGSGLEKMAASFSAMGASLQQLGQNSAAAKAGMILAAIGQIVLGFAQASAKSSKFGIFGWIAAITAGLGVMTSTIATLSSYAQGGIVGGGSYIGDKNLVRVNSGEAILNGSQQKRMFDILNGKGGIGTETTQSISWKIKGSDLYGTLNNYSKKMSSTGKITGIR